MVATTTKTWPTVAPSSTSLLDRRCRPKATDETRVMFSFGVDTCGTRLMVNASIDLIHIYIYTTQKSGLSKTF